jgi:hypothetical protein
MTFIRVSAAALIVIASSTPGIRAQDSTARTVEQYTCKDIIRDTDRDASIAFLHGYLLGKSGSSDFSLETLTRQTDAFIEFCLDNPKHSAVEAMSAAKK